MNIQSVSYIHSVKNYTNKPLSFKGRFSSVPDTFEKTIGKYTKDYITSKELNTLFIKHNFVKDESGAYSKYLSLKDNILIDLKNGATKNLVKNYLETPFSKDLQDAFRGFLSVIKDKKFISEHFDNLFVIYNILNKNSRNYSDANKIFVENKDYGELFQNLAKNFPKKQSTFDAFRRYKGVDCGRINKGLRSGEISDSVVYNEIKEIDKFIDTQVIKNPIKLFRGDGFGILKNVEMPDGSILDLEKELNSARLNKLKLDKLNKIFKSGNITVTQPGFMSTSISKQYSQTIGHSGFDWKFVTAPNTKACFIEPLHSISGMDDEKEVLFKRNSSIRILEAFFDENIGKWCLKGEVSN